MKLLDTELQGQRYISGLILINNAIDFNNDIDVQIGEASDQTSLYRMRLTSIVTKRLDASWVVGSGNGGLDTGAKAINSAYHVWLIQRLDTRVTDVLYSLSPSAPTMPANYTIKRRIGVVMTDAGGNIRQFWQSDNLFYYKTYFVGLLQTALAVQNSDVAIAGLPDDIDIEFFGTFSSTAVNSNVHGRASISPAGVAPPAMTGVLYGGTTMFGDAGAAGAHFTGGPSGEIHYSNSMFKLFGRAGVANQVRLRTENNGGNQSTTISVYGFKDITR